MSTPGLFFNIYIRGIVILFAASAAST